MRRHLVSLVLATSAACAGWLACGSDENGVAGAALTGAHHGRCFSDHVCNSGLVCVNEVCMLPGEPVDGGDDAGRGEVLDPSCVPNPEPNGVVCPGTTPCTAPDANVCCADEPSCGPMRPCSGVVLGCDEPTDCKPGFDCCLTGQLGPSTAGTTCQLGYTLERALCSTPCNGVATPTCAKVGAPCSIGTVSGTCKAVEITLTKGTSRVWRLCVAN